jgi:hypothetical protein
MPRGKPESKREFSKHKSLNPNKSVETSEAPRNDNKEQQLNTEKAQNLNPHCISEKMGFILSFHWQFFVLFLQGIDKTELPYHDL